MIKKFGKTFKVLSKSLDKSGKHKNLGKFTSKKTAEKRLQQIEFFKKQKGN